MKSQISVLQIKEIFRILFENLIRESLLVFHIIMKCGTSTTYPHPIHWREGEGTLNYKSYSKKLVYRNLLVSILAHRQL